MPSFLIEAELAEFNFKFYSELGKHNLSCIRPIVTSLRNDGRCALTSAILRKIVFRGVHIQIGEADAKRFWYSVVRIR